VVADVTDWEAQVKAFKAAISFSKYRTIDVVIPNAGVFDSAILPKEGMLQLFHLTADDY